MLQIGVAWWCIHCCRRNRVVVSIVSGLRFNRLTIECAHPVVNRFSSDLESLVLLAAKRLITFGRCLYGREGKGREVLKCCSNFPVVFYKCLNIVF